MYLALAKVDITDAISVWSRNMRVYLRLWKTELIAPIIEPIFTFFAFGFGVGALISSRVEGLSYLSFIGAGILAFTVLMRTVFELTYGAYFRMVYQSTYNAILSTPVNAESLAFGEILYAATKGLIDALFVIPLVIIFGSSTSYLAPLSIFPLLLGCLFLGSLSLAITAHIREIDHFNLYFALYWSTIFLCGAWFPVNKLFDWLQVIAYILPTTSAIDLTRAFLNGGFEQRHIFEAIYLIIISILLTEWALRSIRKRMVV